MLNILIADDEKLARETIKLLLKESPDIGQIWEAEDGAQAKALANQHLPDLVFLDIEMPLVNGIEVAKHLPARTVVVFVTAYDEYAVAAFELSAVDYLLKPYDDERFHTALQRARKNIQEHKARDYAQISDMIKEIMSSQHKQYRERLVIRDPGRIRLIDVQNILYIAGAGNYAEIHLDDNKCVLHRETLTVLEEQLDPQDFVRIHRSTIVRRSFISELRPNEKGDYSVILNNGDVLTLSRRNRAKLEELTG